MAHWDHVGLHDGVRGCLGERQWPDPMLGDLRLRCGRLRFHGGPRQDEGSATQVEQEFGLAASVRGNGVRDSLVCTAALFDTVTMLHAQNRTPLW
jgi:hypothetical protein